MSRVLFVEGSRGFLYMCVYDLCLPSFTATILLQAEQVSRKEKLVSFPFQLRLHTVTKT